MNTYVVTIKHHDDLREETKRVWASSIKQAEAQMTSRYKWLVVDVQKVR